MEAHLPQVTHEAERFSRIQIAFTAVWVLVFAGILAVVAVVVFNARRSSLEPPPQVRAQPQPRGEVSNVRVDLFRDPGVGQKLKAQQARRLASYGWVDRQSGVVHIPIDAAMDLELTEQR